MIHATDKCHLSYAWLIYVYLKVQIGYLNVKAVANLQDYVLIHI